MCVISYSFEERLAGSAERPLPPFLPVRSSLRGSDRLAETVLPTGIHVPAATHGARRRGTSFNLRLACSKRKDSYKRTTHATEATIPGPKNDR
jgi:hypothetical protein